MVAKHCTVGCGSFPALPILPTPTESLPLVMQHLWGNMDNMHGIYPAQEIQGLPVGTQLISSSKHSGDWLQRLLFPAFAYLQGSALDLWTSAWIGPMAIRLLSKEDVLAIQANSLSLIIESYLPLHSAGRAFPHIPLRACAVLLSGGSLPSLLI